MDSKIAIENLALKFRTDIGLNSDIPIHTKSLLMKLNIIAKYRPLSERSYGLSLKTPDDKFKFILINSNKSRGAQHFTIAHELYHLYYDPSPRPHVCVGQTRDKVELTANNFASFLLMPSNGVIKEIPDIEVRRCKISIGTMLHLEQLFSVSHEAMAYRLKALKIINETQLQDILSMPIMNVAEDFGFDLSLYQPGNNNLLIGDYGEKLRILYESHKISEGHYLELRKMIY